MTKFYINEYGYEINPKLKIYLEKNFSEFIDNYNSDEKLPRTKNTSYRELGLIRKYECYNCHGLTECHCNKENDPVEKCIGTECFCNDSTLILYFGINTSKDFNEKWLLPEIEKKYIKN